MSAIGGSHFNDGQSFAATLFCTKLVTLDCIPFKINRTMKYTWNHLVNGLYVVFGDTALTANLVSKPRHEFYDILSSIGDFNVLKTRFSIN